jgi:hypothetical protein
MHAAAGSEAVIVGLTAVDVTQICGAGGNAILKLAVSARMNQTGAGNDMHLYLSNDGSQPNAQGTACTAYAFNQTGCTSMSDTDSCADAFSTAALTCNALATITVPCSSIPGGLLLRVPVCYAWNQNQACTAVDTGLVTNQGRCGCRNGKMLTGVKARALG